MKKLRQMITIPPMLLAIASLLVAGWIGLARMGWSIPIVAPLSLHGPLMISGFLGTLVGIERAVALQRPWAYVGPFLSAVGIAALFTGMPDVAPVLMAAGSLALLAIYGATLLRHRSIHLIAMATGAAAWLVGNSLWALGEPVFQLVHWWIAFLILTVSAERLELSRLLRLPARSTWSFSGAVVLLFAGLAGSAFLPGLAMPAVGLGYCLLAVWLLFHDVARRTIRQRELPRYSAICLVIGYGWLGVGGVCILLFGPQVAGLLYDAIIHTLMVGFIMSMIFAHAPIILPAVLRRQVRYSPVLYAPLAVLHVSMLLRFASDMLFWGAGRQWGGLLNAAAILLFICVMVYVERLAPTDSGISMPVPDVQPTTEF